ncbi:MAG TPA: hypothetical protein VNQ73_18915 [Ilumatobacter sp.]|nr:hypothetical protein [Ilumatobacter sp.]
MSGGSELDEDAVFAARNAMAEVFKHIGQYVTSQIPRHTIPELPDSMSHVPGALESLGSRVRGAMALAWSAHTAMGNDLYKVAKADKFVNTKLGFWWRAGSAAIDFTSADAFYKTAGGLDLGSGKWHKPNYSGKQQAAAWAGFALNFVPPVKLAAKGAKYGAKGYRRVKVRRPGKPTRPVSPKPPARPGPSRPAVPQPNLPGPRPPHGSPSKTRFPVTTNAVKDMWIGRFERARRRARSATKLLALSREQVAYQRAVVKQIDDDIARAANDPRRVRELNDLRRRAVARLKGYEQQAAGRAARLEQAKQDAARAATEALANSEVKGAARDELEAWEQ